MQRIRDIETLSPKRDVPNKSFPQAQGTLWKRWKYCNRQWAWRTPRKLDLLNQHLP